jgi:hypothetical protein
MIQFKQQSLVSPASMKKPMFPEGNGMEFDFDFCRRKETSKSTWPKLKKTKKDKDKSKNKQQDNDIEEIQHGGDSNPGSRPASAEHTPSPTASLTHAPLTAVDCGHGDIR